MILYSLFGRPQLPISDALAIVHQKFEEIASALNLALKLFYQPATPPFLGVTPGALYNHNPSALSDIEPITIPTTFFITGDAYSTNSLLAIDPILKPFQNLTLPLSHRLEASQICRTLLENPLYFQTKPLIPILFDPYLLASPSEIAARLKVIKLYKKAISTPLTKKEHQSFQEAVRQTFETDSYSRFEYNRTMLHQLDRIFPNSLNALWSNEPPSPATKITHDLAKGKPIIELQLNFLMHAQNQKVENFHYLYLSSHPLNLETSLPSARFTKCVGLLPLSLAWIQLPSPPQTNMKTILITSGGSGAAVHMMIKMLLKLKLDQPITFAILTSLPQSSSAYLSLKQTVSLISKDGLFFRLIPRTNNQNVRKAYATAHAVIGVPGIYTLLETIASGRPMAAQISSDKNVFTSHLYANARFAREAWQYPVKTISHIDRKAIEYLLHPPNLQKAQQVSAKLKPELAAAPQRWRQEFNRYKKRWYQ